MGKLVVFEGTTYYHLKQDGRSVLVSMNLPFLCWRLKRAAKKIRKLNQTIKQIEVEANQL